MNRLDWISREGKKPGVGILKLGIERIKDETRYAIDSRWVSDRLGLGWNGIESVLEVD
jgi:hypothetical protein